MSNGRAGWLCKSCKGPDGSPWRTWSDKTKCHKCKLSKTACYLKNAAGGTGSPTVSARGGKGGGGGSGPVAVAKGELDKLKAQVAKLSEPDKDKRALEAELKRVREELQAVKAGQGLLADPTAGQPADGDAELDLLREHIKALTGIPGVEDALAAKQGLLAQKLQTKREAKPNPHQGPREHN